eukprot:1765962-Prymnesium_polylepis.1
MGKRAAWSRSRQSICPLQYDVLAVDDSLVRDPNWMNGLLSVAAARVAVGELHALPVTTFDAWREHETAFRLLQSGVNTGKVVLRIPYDAPRSEMGFTHVLTGGTGGLGVLSARWLAEADSQASLVLASRSGTFSASTSAARLEWSLLCAMDAAIRLESCDVQEDDSVRHLLCTSAIGLPP